MKLEDIVPPLFLCKQIPDGCFADSEMIHQMQDDETWWEVVQRCDMTGEPAYPAPTLEEILAEIDKISGIFHISVWTDKCQGWNAQTISWKKATTLREKEQSAATAALKLWLEAKGMKMMEDRKEKFTPGPWEIDPELHDAVRANACLICSAWTLPDCAHGTREANVALISAAPEMYEKLKDLLDAMEAGLFPQAAPGVDYPAVMEKKLELRKLLKKARGEE